MGTRFIDADPQRQRLGGLLTGPELRSAQRAVLFIHDIAEDSSVWPLTMSRLDDDTVGIAPDLRGRGMSADLGAPYGLRAHANDLADLLDGLGVDHVVVVGHAMGAIVGGVFGHLFRGRLLGLVSVHGGPGDAVLGSADPVALLGALANSETERRLAADAVWADGDELMADDEIRSALSGLGVPGEHLRVESDPRAGQEQPLRVTTVPGVSPGRLVADPAGADAIAHALRRVWRSVSLR